MELNQSFNSMLGFSEELFSCTISYGFQLKCVKKQHKKKTEKTKDVKFKSSSIKKPSYTNLLKIISSKKNLNVNTAQRQQKNFFALQMASGKC